MPKPSEQASDSCKPAPLSPGHHNVYSRHSAHVSVMLSRVPDSVMTDPSQNFELSQLSTENQKQDDTPLQTQSTARPAQPDSSTNVPLADRQPSSKLDSGRSKVAIPVSIAQWDAIESDVLEKQKQRERDRQRRVRAESRMGEEQGEERITRVESTKPRENNPLDEMQN